MLVGVLAAAGLTVGLTLSHLDGQYGPIESGHFGGVFPRRYADYLRTGYKLGPHEAEQAFAALDNRGAHPVKVISIDPGPFATDIEWSVYRFHPGGPLSGMNTPWRSFPATIPAHGTIRLLITLHHPSFCSRVQRGTIDGTCFGDHEVHWESLLGDRTTEVELFADDGIRVC
jgi:hypothetical protein